MPAGLKKCLTRLLPNGEAQNLRLTNAYYRELSFKDNKTEHRVHIDAVVDGPYAGDPVEDDLRISTSQREPGTFYLNRSHPKAKMYPVLDTCLTDEEFNALVGELDKVGDQDEVGMLKACAAALDNASNPGFRAKVIHSEPEDPKKNPPFNKLFGEGADIHMYLNADEEINDGKNLTSYQQEANEAASVDLSPEDEAEMNEALG